MNYNHTNNGHATFANPVSETSTTFLLGGTYNTLPTGNFIARVSKYSSGVLAWRENVYIANRSGATCTWVVRAIEPVPINDTSNAQVQQALPFSAWDIIESTISGEFMRKHLREIATNWVFVSKDWVEFIATWTNWQVVGFDPNGKPTVFSPTLDIWGLTQSSIQSNSDMFVFRDATSWLNKKIDFLTLRRQCSDLFWTWTINSQDSGLQYSDWYSTPVSIWDFGIGILSSETYSNNGGTRYAEFQYSFNGWITWTSSPAVYFQISIPLPSKSATFFFPRNCVARVRFAWYTWGYVASFTLNYA